jgi:hypothetical protein
MAWGSFGREGNKGKILGAYLTDCTITNYDTLYRLHIAQKFSKDTTRTILQREHQHQQKGG